MSASIILGVVPDRSPSHLLRMHNGHGWSANIWGRLLRANGMPDEWRFNLDDTYLEKLWGMIEELPDWQQAPLVLTFDVGVIPWQEFEWAADMLEQFERTAPGNPKYVNHVPEVAAFLRTKPEVPLIGVWGTTVSENSFLRWDNSKEDDFDYEGDGIPLSEMYVLERHRHHLPGA